MSTSARSSGYDYLPDENTPDEKPIRKDTTRDLNGSYILACRGSESLENSEAGEDSTLRVHQPLSNTNKNSAVYTSIAHEDVDIESGEPKPRRSTRIIHDSIADRSLPNPANISFDEVHLLCNSLPDLTSLPNPESDSDAPLCRICHEGDEEEDLLSPCFCSGTVGALHMSCLEQWLGASDKTRCEICGFQFSIKKNPKPVTWYLKNKALGQERRYMIADIMCAVCFTPFTIGAVTGCLVGAQYFTSVNKDWQATTLILLAMTNMLIFFLWCWFTARRNYILCSSWRDNFQEVKIKYNPPDKNNNRETCSRGTSITDRMLLESSFPAIHSSTFSPENFTKPITRKVTYETSPRNKIKDKTPCTVDEDDSTLKPGTPYPRRKGGSKVKQKVKTPEQTIEIDSAQTMMVELEKTENAIADGHHRHKNGHLHKSVNTSTSTPALSTNNLKKHNIFDEKHCTATPIQHPHYEIIPAHNNAPEIIYANQVVLGNHPGMFVETPYGYAQTNVAARTMTRRGLLFQAAPLASEENSSVSAAESIDHDQCFE